MEYVVYESIYYGLQLSWDSSQTLLGYSDSDWAGYLDTQRSTTGFVVYLGCNLISWCSQMQTTVARSSAEAKYHALAYVVAELYWILKLFRQLQISLSSPPRLICDKNNAIFIASSSMTKSRSKNMILTIILYGNLLLKRLVVSALSPHTSSWLMFSQKGWPNYSFYWIVASCSFFHHANFEGDIRGKSDSSDNNQDISDSS